MGCHKFSKIFTNFNFILDITFGIFVIWALVNLRSSILRKQESLTELIAKPKTENGPIRVTEIPVFKKFDGRGTHFGPKVFILPERVNGTDKFLTKDAKHIKESAAIPENDKDFEDKLNGLVFNLTLGLEHVKSKMSEMAVDQLRMLETVVLLRMNELMVNWLNKLIITSSFALGLSTISLLFLCKNTGSWVYLLTSAFGTISPFLLATLYGSLLISHGSVISPTGMPEALAFHWLLTESYKKPFFYIIISYRLLVLYFVGAYVYDVEGLDQGQGQMNCKKPVGVGNENDDGNKKVSAAIETV